MLTLDSSNPSPATCSSGTGDDKAGGAAESGADRHTSVQRSQDWASTGWITGDNEESGMISEGSAGLSHPKPGVVHSPGAGVVTCGGYGFGASVTAPSRSTFLTWMVANEAIGTSSPFLNVTKPSLIW